MNQDTRRGFILSASIAVLALSLDPAIPFTRTPLAAADGNTLMPGLNGTQQNAGSAASLGSSPPRTRLTPPHMRRLMSEMPGLKQLVSPPSPNTPPAPVSPSIGVSTTSLSFHVQQGEGNLATRSLTITNTGGGTLHWNAATTAPWLNLSPPSGIQSGVVRLTATTSSLALGTYNETIILSAEGTTPVSIPVNLVIVAPPVSSPVVRAHPISLSFSALQGSSNPSSQTISITSANGGGPVSWSASHNAPWLTLSPTSGTNSGSITASATIGSLAVGTHHALVTIRATGAPSVSIPISFTVTQPSQPPSPTVSLSPASLTFSGLQGGTNPSSQTVAVSSNTDWNAQSSASWLTISPSSGQGNGLISTSVVLSSVNVGTNTASITVTSGGVRRTIPVTLTVTGISLALSANSLSYTATKGAANPSDKTLTVQSNGTWTVSDTAPWLSLSPTSGSNNGTITASVNTKNAPQENNTATITVTSGGVTKAVHVTLTLNAPSSSSITLTWEGNQENDLAGYRVYRATTSGGYGAPIATIRGNVTTYQATGLQFGTTYFFVVTAFDTTGNESGYSNEVSKSIF